LRKLAKHNSARLNTLYEDQKLAEKKRVLSSTNTSAYNSTLVARKNVAHRRTYLPPAAKVLASGNQHNISANSASATPARTKDFVIKQKAKR
jgi:hypothetical protein